MATGGATGDAKDSRGETPRSGLEAIILAAGKGSRFGGGKLLAPWGGGALLHGALAAAFAAPVRSVSLVWGADSNVAKAARAWAEAQGEAGRLRLIHAADFALGLSASLRAGVDSLPPDAAGAYVFLGDMPRVPHEALIPLAKALAAGAPAAAPWFGGRRGHPVLFGSDQFPALRALTGDRGAGDLLKALGDAVAKVPAPDDGVLFDVDQPADLI
ncbi:MAG: nucleotidyltransferase family protein [Caulobacteraceae bacterium]|nr:nucleotidyltransferase family protein [Caulobacteraceae bacterium]